MSWTSPMSSTISLAGWTAVPRSTALELCPRPGTAASSSSTRRACPRPRAQAALDARPRRAVLPRDQLTGDVEHLLIGTSCRSCFRRGCMTSRRSTRCSRPGPSHPRLCRDPSAGGAPAAQGRSRALGSLQRGLCRGLELVMAVARGERGRAPSTITFLSGDVTTPTSRRSRRRGARCPVTHRAGGLLAHPQPGAERTGHHDVGVRPTPGGADALDRTRSDPSPIPPTRGGSRTARGGSTTASVSCA